MSKWTERVPICIKLYGLIFIKTKNIFWHNAHTNRHWEISDDGRRKKERKKERKKKNEKYKK